MANFGFELDEFPGNFTVVMAHIDKETLAQSGICPNDYSINNEQPGWIVISPTDSYDRSFLDELASEVSTKLSCKSIRISYADTAGVLMYTLYSNGQQIEGYSYGPDYSDEMEEAGVEPPAAKENETIIRDGEDEFIYFSLGNHPEESKITDSDEFMNWLFNKQEAHLSWDYLP